jgi:hypothetical protein
LRLERERGDREREREAFYRDGGLEREGDRERERPFTGIEG